MMKKPGNMRNEKVPEKFGAICRNRAVFFQEKVEEHTVGHTYLPDIDPLLQEALIPGFGKEPQDELIHLCPDFLV